MLIPTWQRLISLFIYMLPWSDALPFGRYIFMDFPLLKWLAIPAFPIIAIEQMIPLGGLIIFFLLFLGVVRNSNIPYFIRFNALQAILIDIGIILINYAFQILIQPIGERFIISTLSSTVLISSLAICCFAILECIQGKEADLPGISEAVRMQL